MFSRLNPLLQLVMVLLWALLPGWAGATAPVTAGAVFQVSGVVNSGPGCDPPGIETFSATLTVTNVIGTGPFNFDATLRINDDVNSVGLVSNVPLQTNGTFGPGSGTFSDSDGGAGTLSGLAGVVSGTSISFTVSFNETTPLPACNGTLTASGSQVLVINPETTSPAQQTQQADALAALSPTGVVGQVGRYTGSLVSSQRRGGPSLNTGSLSISTRGLSAGDAFEIPLGVWLSGSYTASEDDFATTRFESDRFNVTGGVDVSIDDTYIVGLSLGLEAADTETPTNNGQQDSKGFTVAPYVAALITDNISFDMALGFSRLYSDQSRGRGNPITSDTLTKRWFVAANGTWAESVGDWYLSGRTGIVWLTSDIKAFTESDGTVNPGSQFRVGQVNFGGEAAYSYDESWEPYVGATLTHAYSKTRRVFAANVNAPNDDRTDLLVNFGVRYFGDSGFSGGFEYSTLLLRDNYSEHSFQLNVRAEF